MSAKVLNQTMIVVSSYEIAEEMLEKKSTIYSDRPVMPMAGELGGWNNITTLVRGKKQHSTQRRLMQRTIGTETYMKAMHPTQERETQMLLQRLLNMSSPDDLNKVIRQ